MADIDDKDTDGKVQGPLKGGSFWCLCVINPISM